MKEGISSASSPSPSRPAGRRRAAAALLIIGALLPSSAIRADISILDIWYNSDAPSRFLFPNWNRVYVGSFDVWLCEGCGTGPEMLTGITVVNFGTATSADIAYVYWRVTCPGVVNSATFTMTYAGNYQADSGTYPAWTWSGTSPDLSACPDLCGSIPCGSYFTIQLYADIAPCPANMATVNLGFPVRTVGSWIGSISDNTGFFLPWVDTNRELERDTLVWTLKRGPKDAPPGDTVTYTIFYGRPGNADLSGITIVDTQPPYTHYVQGSANPAPVPGWDPLIGTPPVLMWHFNGPIPTAWGPTGIVTMNLSVDWGNGESFEPGSGDIAAPEGERLNNFAQVFFENTSCGTKSIVSPPVSTVVRRYLFWKVADNDILFSQNLGQPADEIIYSIFLKNISADRTWWNVTVWDTVPPELDNWGTDCGFEDPCVGWTMTPWGCPAAVPGWRTVAGNTVLTWRLDMPPAFTVTLRWKAKVKTTTAAGTTAVNRASVLAQGRTNVVDGTGHAGVSRNFAHQAPIILPTMYTSYIGFAYANNNAFTLCDNAPLGYQTYFLSFYPLNKRTDFLLFQQQHTADAFATWGGLSPPITAAAGGCLTGGAEWIAGCKAERAPAIYWPMAFRNGESPLPTHNLYKVVSNSPLIWELLTNISYNDEMGTYLGTTNLTYAGFTSYGYCSYCSDGGKMGLYIANTSETLPTTVHVFRWNPAYLGWDYITTEDINRDSQWFFNTPSQESYMVITSDVPVIIHKGFYFGGVASTSSMAPNRENGYIVSDTIPATFYAYAGEDTYTGGSLIVGNVGLVPATYELWEYFSDDPTIPALPATHLTPNLVGNSGRFVLLGVRTVGAGLASPANGDVLGPGYTTGVLNDPLSLYKIRLLSGGPIQVYNGMTIVSDYGAGSVLHAANGKPQGNEFWFHRSLPANFSKSPCDSPNFDTMTLEMFLPKTGTAVQCEGNAGYSARYTTNGPDECISFKALTPPPSGLRRNYRITATGGIIGVAHEIRCQIAQKNYTAPFLSQGTFYRIIAPPVAYTGQPFWITVVVVEMGGATDTNYTGNTSFSSTDPSAKIEGAAMASYDYAWQGAGYENGVRVFVNVVLNQLGLQTIVGMDTQDGSINGLTTVMVVAADVKLTKSPRLAIASSGEAIQFRICWSNYSSATAANFVITDAVPMGTSYVPEAASLMFCGAGGPAAPTVTVAYGGASATTPGVFNTLTSPTQTAPASTRWLRWTVQDVYVYSTGCICFRVRVD